MLAANLASFLNYASLAVVGEAGAGASECDGGQADRENCRGADPGTTVGRGADGPGPRVAPGLVQCVLGESQVAKWRDPGEQAAGDQRGQQPDAGDADDVARQHEDAAGQAGAGHAELECADRDTSQCQRRP